MSSPGHQIGLTTLWLLLGCFGVGVDAADQVSTPAVAPADSPPPSISPALAAPGTPGEPAAPIALPVESSTGGPHDLGTNRRFYTLTAELREIYDDNVNTTSIDKQSSFETQLSPSVLVQFTEPNDTLSARYTFFLTYYTNRGTTQGTTGNDNSSTEYTHEFVLQETHTFSERFALNVAEQFRYFTEPDLYQGIGTNFRNGAYFSNTLDGSFTAQWTPLFGTTSTYSNNILRYQEAAVAAFQNSIENTGSQNFSWAVFPKISANVGAIVDDISYDDPLRGYENYTLYVGGQWQVLPSLSLTARGGGSYTDPDFGKAEIGPYAEFSVAWDLGAKSHLSFDYSHEITPSDQNGVSGQTSDRATASFEYNISSKWAANLLLAVQKSTVPDGFQNNQFAVSSNETVFDIVPNFTYHINSYLDLNGQVDYTGVSSQGDDRSYRRTQYSLGIRGTY